MGKASPSGGQGIITWSPERGNSWMSWLGWFVNRMAGVVIAHLLLLLLSPLLLLLLLLRLLLGLRSAPGEIAAGQLRERSNSRRQHDRAQHYRHMYTSGTQWRRRFRYQRWGGCCYCRGGRQYGKHKGLFLRTSLILFAYCATAAHPVGGRFARR